MAQTLLIRPVITEVRIREKQAPRVSTYPREHLRVIQAASPAGSGGGGSSGGVQPFQHQQLSASAEWIVNHNLGRHPVSVSVLSLGFQEVGAEVQHVTVNQTRVRFVQPQTGYVRIL